MPVCSQLENPQWQLTEYRIVICWVAHKKLIEIIYLICGKVTWETCRNTDT